MIKRTKLGEPYRVSYISNDGRCEAGAIFALIRTNKSFYCIGSETAIYARKG